MLYATTRNINDVHTAYKVIHTDCAGDGGLFIPLRFPQWDQKRVLTMLDGSFGQNVAAVLNDFFGCGLTGWDIEFALGRAPLVMKPIHKIVIAEAWHNTHWDFDHAVQVISDILRKEDVGKRPTNWVRVSVAIAFLFATYAEYLRPEPGRIHKPVDLAVSAGDFCVTAAAWYARTMGLSIGNIICCCNVNGGVWELLHKGSYCATSLSVRTAASRLDVAAPRDLERVIHLALGKEETAKYLVCLQEGTAYKPSAEALAILREGLKTYVVSDSRIRTLIPGVYHTTGYIFAPCGAVAYGGLTDYRAKTGESRLAILFAQRSPIGSRDMICKSLGISAKDLEKKLT